MNNQLSWHSFTLKGNRYLLTYVLYFPTWVTRDTKARVVPVTILWKKNE